MHHAAASAGAYVEGQAPASALPITRFVSAPGSSLQCNTLILVNHLQDTMFGWKPTFLFGGTFNPGPPGSNHPAPANAQLGGSSHAARQLSRRSTEKLLRAPPASFARLSPPLPPQLRLPASAAQ